MSISTITGVVYANQATPAVAQVHKEQLARIDFQGAVMQEMFKEKEQEVQEARPPEETTSLHPDEQSQHEGYHPQKHDRHHVEPTSDEEAQPPSPHQLDILA